MDGGQGPRGLHELDELVVATLEPLRAVGAGKSGLKGERKTGGIKV